MACASTFSVNGALPFTASNAVSASVNATSALPWPMNFLFSTEAVVCCAPAEIFIFLLRTSARPAPGPMYPPPVPPVTMFSVLPVKSGVADAPTVPDAPGDDVAVVARGAEHAAASRTRVSGMTRSALMSYLRSLPDGEATRESLGRARAAQSRRPALLGCPHPAPLLLGLHDERRQRDRLPGLVDRYEDEVRRRDVHDLSGEEVLGFHAHADLHARAPDVIDGRLRGDEIADVHRCQERQLVDECGHDAAASVTRRGRAGARVDELHHLAAVHVPVWVRVRREHRARHDRLRSRHRSALDHGRNRTRAHAYFRACPPSRVKSYARPSARSHRWSRASTPTCSCRRTASTCASSVCSASRRPVCSARATRCASPPRARMCRPTAMAGGTSIAAVT